MSCNVLDDTESLSEYSRSPALGIIDQLLEHDAEGASSSWFNENFSSDSDSGDDDETRLGSSNGTDDEVCGTYNLYISPGKGYESADDSSYAHSP